MTQNSLCDFCGATESVRHMLWECERVRAMWEKLGSVFGAFDPVVEITYNAVFVGFKPTRPILESILTRVTRSVVSREREHRIQIPIIKQELVVHCGCNIYSFKNREKRKED